MFVFFKHSTAYELRISDGSSDVCSSDLEKEARKLTGEHGVDHVIEVGGSDTFPRSIMAVRLGGHIAVIGLLSGMTKDVNVAAIFSQNVKTIGRASCRERVC